ncbi:MAG: permease [Candidatus Altiarchaeales archaeon]|nr:permease [Candidatus Altiarchaeales archaeon]MBD3416885.1 permease [Candidatus Altiarchaeales archaeon]
MEGLMNLWGEAAITSLGFFWKSGWAFILGYSISAMIQAFVPRSRLTRHMGSDDIKSISLSTVFGAASSSCSFAALATARSLFQKGAHFITAVAFMFASTNLVIELGILILVFLGWQFLAAEIIGGLVLIVISSVLIRLTYPRKWVREAREKLEVRSHGGDEDFDWKKRIGNMSGWYLAGDKFIGEWRMVWEDILIGFTIAGFVAVFVPAGFWGDLFLTDQVGVLPQWAITLENAMIAPIVAAATFIGSMGNIPLATVLNSNGVLFAGIMGFIYSDLMVPPLVRVNAKYYGWGLALYVAGIMYVSIVATALILHGIFAFFSLTPESAKEVSDIVTFKVDYTFWLNILFILVAVAWAALAGRHEGEGMEMETSGKLKNAVSLAAGLTVVGGVIIYLMI